MFRIFKIALFFATIIFLVSCSQASTSTSSSSVKNLPVNVDEENIISIKPILNTVENTHCNPPKGWRDVYERAPGGIHMFGEWHGTNEAPDIVVEYACAIGEATGEKTIALFEAEHRKLEAFQKALSVKYDDSENILRQGLMPFWKSKQDGRKSRAMMDGMLRIKQLHDLGVPIEIGSTGISDEEFLSIYNKEIPMSELYNMEARNMLEDKKQYTNIITLTGNFHTARHANYFKSVEYDNYVALNYIFFGGQAFSCTKGTCGVHDLEAPIKTKYFLDVPDRSLVLNNDIDPVFKGWYIVKTPTPIEPYLKIQ